MITDSEAIITSKVQIRDNALTQFAEWQSQLHAAITSFEGFVSLEISSTVQEGQPVWDIIQCFSDPKHLDFWIDSKERKQFLNTLSGLIVKNSAILENHENARAKNCVTEIFVTQIKPELEEAYRQWIAKIHEEEAKFPGFRGVYMKTPTHAHDRNWITLLQFDTPENLDRWLNSDVRKKILLESNNLITSLESHRMISPYAGWFSSIARDDGMPPVWKQTMLVLLVLFPVVMLELKYLSPVTAGLDLSVATFIGNAISVALISWPLMPITIRFLGWWLAPKGTSQQRRNSNLFGTVLILLLYALEIFFFMK